MSVKYKSEVIGKNGIAARVVAKSKSAYSDTILTTWEYDAPKCILAELNTHGMLVKNAQSSRAVPVKKVIEQIRNNPVTPVHWGSNQSGMVAGDEIDTVVKLPRDWDIVGGHTLDESVYFNKDVAWENTASIVATLMECWEDAGYHKQIVNRIGEAFVMVRGVISGTEIDNFFHLRYHPDADPYIQELARCMWEAYEQAETEVLYDDEWHTPYYGNGYWKPNGSHTCEGFYLDSNRHTLQFALKSSAAACGQVSYRKLDLSEETVERVWDRLMCGDIVHASVTCHQATPVKYYDFYEREEDLGCMEKGVTHVDTNKQKWSAQFKHWIMHRHLIPNESFKGKFVPPTKNKSEV